MRTDSPVLDRHGLTPGPAVDERGAGAVMSGADFIRGWVMRLGLLGIFTWFPQVRHPALTGDWSAARVAGAGGSMVRAAVGIDRGDQRAGAARLRFELAA